MLHPTSPFFTFFLLWLRHSSFIPICPTSHGPQATPGAFTRGGRSIWTSSWWAKWRCRTPSPCTPTRGPQCASTARGSSEASSARACSARVSASIDLMLGLTRLHAIWLCDAPFLDCKFNCHKRCALKVPNDCLGETIGGERRSLLFPRFLFCYTFWVGGVLRQFRFLQLQNNMGPFMFSSQKPFVFMFSENRSNCGKCCLATVAGSFAWHLKRRNSCCA